NSGLFRLYGAILTGWPFSFPFAAADLAVIVGRLKRRNRMRQLGDIVGRPRADRFLAFLAKQGIEATLREDGEGQYSVWVINEDHLEEAEQHFRAFKASPEASVFDAPPLPKQPPRPSRGALGRSRHIDVRREIFGRGAARKMPVTVAFIVLSVVLT